ncbi:MAG: tetratricopeptide repeat protein, partial [Woeseia sp.]
MQHRTRRFAPGTVIGATLCLLATAALIIVASLRNGDLLAVVKYDLPPNQVLTGKLPPVSARENLALFSSTGDTRFLAYAHVILNAAETRQGAAEISPALMLLRARILQAEHHFDAAADILNKVVQRRPGSPEAWLLLADSSIRAGRLDDARSTCFKLALAVDAGLAQWCAILVLQASGEDALAYRRAQAELASASTREDSVRRWMLEIAADSAARTGQLQEAIELYTRVVTIGGESLASRLALADVLLAAEKNADVIALLNEDRDKIAASIRLTMAREASGSPVRDDTLERIKASFMGMSPENTDDLRLRDRAIF